MADRKPVELTQAQVLELLGMGLRRFKNLQAEAGLPGARPKVGTYDGRAVVSWWVDFNLSQVIDRAQPEVGPGEQQKLKESDERARLYKAQADAKERENAIAIGELVPAAVIEGALAQVVGELAAALDALPSQIKSDLPHLRAPEVDLIATRLARTRNRLATIEVTHTHAAG